MHKLKKGSMKKNNRPLYKILFIFFMHVKNVFFLKVYKEYYFSHRSFFKFTHVLKYLSFEFAFKYIFFQKWYF